MTKETKHTIREAVKAGRTAKKEAMERSLDLAKRRGAELELLIKQSREEVLPHLEEEYKDWVGQRKGEIAEYLTSIPQEEQRKAFLEGLDLFIKLNYRLAKKQGKKNAMHKEALTDLIAAYAFDFFLSLRFSKRDGVAPKTALSVARRSYRFNPNELIHLRKEFPGVEESTLRYILTSSDNPRERLRQIQKTLHEISAEQEFHWAPQWVIKTAVAKHKNPREFLRNVQKNAEDIQNSKPTIPRAAILDAVVIHHRNPIAYLREELGYEVA